MFKNAIIYRITALPIDALGADACLDSHPFTPCLSSQEKSMGWVPPRGEAHGALIESVHGQWIASLMTQTRSVPSAVITKKTNDLVAKIEAKTARTLGKKAIREIKDDIKFELLPLAFPKDVKTLVWIDPAAMLLVIDATSQARADDVVSMLVTSLPGLAMALVQTKVSPTAAMSAWLAMQESPDPFAVGAACELRAADDSKTVVRYENHDLFIPEILAHIKAGLAVTKMALQWGNVSFVLTQGMQIKGLDFGASQESQDQNSADSFDADMAIVTGELRKMIPELFWVLGGVVA